MAEFALSAMCRRPYDEAVQVVREELAAAGFGVITEIDLAATLAAKLDVAVPPQLILGACNPRLAYAAVRAEPAVAVLLPCNVVVRSAGASATVVDAFDPGAMSRLAGAADEDLAAVAAEARHALRAALARVEERGMPASEED
jgi:uncharacterized protein (DUF302 family)